LACLVYENEVDEDVPAQQNEKDKTETMKLISEPTTSNISDKEIVEQWIAKNPTLEPSAKIFVRTLAMMMSNGSFNNETISLDSLNKAPLSSFKDPSLMFNPAQLEELLALIRDSLKLNDDEEIEQWQKRTEKCRVL
jgi:hypothetical protein